jgi:hypothetical protein
MPTASDLGTNPAQLETYLNQSVPAAYQPLVNTAFDAAIGAYTAWYEANASKLTASDSAKYALQILTAIDAGLNAALGPVASTTPPTTSTPAQTAPTATAPETSAHSS